MMQLSSRPKVTKLVCPSCKGTGQFPITSLKLECLWCHGSKRLPVVDALRYADTTYMIAGGGYVVGDHNFSHMVDLERQAEAIYGLAGIQTPWVRR